jgi:NAD(P)-dependent dehydrogenase (short-subunit alcohol dehydrogenase family)
VLPSGVAPTGLVDWMGVGHYRGVMEVNFFGAVAVTKAVLPLIKNSAREGW